MRDFLSDLRKNGTPFYLSWQVYYEYLWVTTHPKLLKSNINISQASQDLEFYLKHPQCNILSEGAANLNILHTLFKKYYAVKGQLVHDFHYAALLYEHGIKNIVTADVDFKKFDFLKVINPWWIR